MPKNLSIILRQPIEKLARLREIAAVEPLTKNLINSGERRPRLLPAALVREEAAEADRRAQLEGASALSARDAERLLKGSLSRLKVLGGSQELALQTVQLGDVVDVELGLRHRQGFAGGGQSLGEP